MIKTESLVVKSIEFPTTQSFDLPMCTTLAIRPATLPRRGDSHASVEVVFGSLDAHRTTSRYFMDSLTLRAWAAKFEEIAESMDAAVAALKA